jgi:hypothetical protein
MCVEILAEIIKQNKKIKGIKVKNYEYKIIQYADDTTLLLDGTKTSLQEALNTMQSFYTISGLKINPAKTQVIWIGENKFSKNKLDVSVPLTWNCNSFKLLGINFNVNLSHITQDNLSKQIQDIQRLLLFWQKQKLTVFGKITIIKTIVLSKLTHYFTSLPNPNEEFINQLQNMLFKFLWDNKPDKISRKQAYKSYTEGGLNMVDILKFIKSLKITWLKRLINNSESPWVSLFENTICPLEKLFKTGPLWFKNSKKCLENIFWYNTFEAFVEICSTKYKGNDDILTTPISYNPLLNTPDFFNKNLFSKNVVFLCDIISQEGNLFSYNELKEKFNIPNFHILDYLKLKNNVKDKIKNCSCPVKTPFIPMFLDIILCKNFNCGLMYKHLNIQIVNEKYKQKWSQELNIQTIEWAKCFKVCLSSKLNNSLMWFQYKIIFRILGTNYQRYKMKQIDSPNCQHCDVAQDLIHMFVDCPLVTPIWDNIQHKLITILNWPHNLDKTTILLGYLDQEYLIPINFILITAKYYIFQSIYNKKLLKTTDLWKEIQTHYRYQKQVFQSDINIWSPLEQILEF